MTEGMKELLNQCFDARLRELQGLLPFAEGKIKTGIEEEIKLVSSVKECHIKFEILKTN